MIWMFWSSTIVVDQIHDDVAVVEWENETLSVIEKRWLPQSVKEGDVLLIELERVPLSNCRLWVVQERQTDRWLQCDGLEPLYLPVAPDWKGRMPVYWNIQHEYEISHSLSESPHRTVFKE